MRSTIAALRGAVELRAERQSFHRRLAAAHCRRTLRKCFASWLHVYCPLVACEWAKAALAAAQRPLWRLRLAVAGFRAAVARRVAKGVKCLFSQSVSCPASVTVVVAELFVSPRKCLTRNVLSATHTCNTLRRTRSRYILPAIVFCLRRRASQRSGRALCRSAATQRAGRLAGGAPRTGGGAGGHAGPRRAHAPASIHAAGAARLGPGRL